MAISGTGAGISAMGIIFLWSAIKGASVSASLRELISGQQPTGTNVNPIQIAPPTVAQANITAGATNAGNAGITPGVNQPSGTPSAHAANILAIAASMKGHPYTFGGGHGANPCVAGGFDCSGYVSCVLNKAGLMHGSMATGGLAGIGTSVPYAQRAPGDIIVWNGGTGGGHCGIIIDGSTMWNNLCTACGGVNITHYPTLTRTAAAAVVRRL